MNKTNTLWTRRVRPFLRTALCLTMLGIVPATVVSACGAPAKVMPTEWAKAPSVSIMLTFKSTNNHAKSFEAGIISSLTSTFSTAGYNIVTEESAAQVVAQVNISATEEKTVIPIVMNNKPLISYAVRVDATFLGKIDKALIDKGTASYDGDKGEVEDGAIADIVVQLNTTKKLHKYSTQLAELEEKMWKDAGVKDCQDAISKTSCDNVIAYMQTYPDGKYASEAKKALDDNKLAEELNLDDESWAAADAESCKAPTKATDCDGVQRYLKKYPNGTHRAEAKAVLKQSEARITLLERQQSATLKKERRESCVKACRRRYRSYSPGSYNILVNRCVRDDCS